MLLCLSKNIFSFFMFSHEVVEANMYSFFLNVLFPTPHCSVCSHGREGATEELTGAISREGCYLPATTVKQLKED